MSCFFVVLQSRVLSDKRTGVDLDAVSLCNAHAALRPTPERPHAEYGIPIVFESAMHVFPLVAGFKRRGYKTCVQFIIR